jgi:hypothetical protein
MDASLFIIIFMSHLHSLALTARASVHAGTSVARRSGMTTKQTPLQQQAHHQGHDSVKQETASRSALAVTCLIHPARSENRCAAKNRQ